MTRNRLDNSTSYEAS